MSRHTRRAFLAEALTRSAHEGRDAWTRITGTLVGFYVAAAISAIGLVAVHDVRCLRSDRASCLENGDAP